MAKTPPKKVETVKVVDGVAVLGAKPPTPPPVKPQIVLAGFLKSGGEFSRIVDVDVVPTTRLVSADDRQFEYTGDDAEGRRIYRDHTRY